MSVFYPSPSRPLATPLVSPNREYRGEHLERLQFIRHCRSLQLGLPEIRVLLDLKVNPSSGC
ncbi:MerR family DNA-binding protein [Noviherbaspirillum cavernae]|uniref:MerR family DNA-binding protein n=1 Tax=Noviherbaspirillum cavernae TaxID=2320862 RepID=UPI001F5B9EC5|nr:MerR family DNA-binding protein [Noviherbaspirillum cavernae]